MQERKKIERKSERKKERLNERNKEKSRKEKKIIGSDGRVGGYRPWFKTSLGSIEN